MAVRVQTPPFEPGRLVDAFSKDCAEAGAGAIVSFVGLCRDVNEGRRVTAMTLEHYPGMTEKQLARLEQEARRRWPLDGVLIVHRIGRLLPGEPIVVVAAASAHRQAAFDACSFLMDWLKTQAPFWKWEETTECNAWVDARSSDGAAAARWQAD